MHDVVLAASRRAKHVEQDPWTRAIELRQRLEATPPEQRSRDRFEEVLNAFRGIYHHDPASSKAPAAVAEVGDLLAEKGRVLKDAQALRAAIGQYEFLREQYPHSPQVESALLLEGEICRQDLNDMPCAREKLSAVVENQAGTSFAEQAALELKAMKQRNPLKSTARSQQGNVPGSLASTAVSTSSKSRASKSSTESPAPNDGEPKLTPAEDPEPINAASIQDPSGSGDAEPISHGTVQITGMRHWSNPTSTRIAIDLGGKVAYEAVRVPNPDRIYFDLHGARLSSKMTSRQTEVIDDGFLKRIRAAQYQPGVTRVVLDVTDVSEYSAFLLPNPWRLIIDIHGSAARTDPSVAVKDTSSSSRSKSSTDNTVADVARLSTEPSRVAATAGPTSDPVSAQVPQAEDDGATSSALPHAADPTSDGQRSLVRALGLKVGRIVIDAGHGGHDSGTLGPGGIEEKDVVLDVALRTGKLLHAQLGAEIVYTRSDDTFIPLETRTAIANKAQADLFLSIHGNSSPEPSARGVETYYLNFTADPSALDVAARENAVSNHSIHQLSDLVRKITLKDKIDESREFAADVDQGLYAGLKAGNPGLKNRGVKKAPFVVLIGAQMPSVLAEISFLTNPEDAREMSQAAYRERIAESLTTGVERYLRGLSGTRPMDKARTPARALAKAGEPVAGR
jgi:N-acetylmuramoyl-L-alanine amidase